MEFRKALAPMLHDRGISQAELARRIGASRSYVSQLMSGKIDEPALSVAYAIADALNMTVDDFKPYINED
jgi:transcriptional regulator with XRE-family HTH domain